MIIKYSEEIDKLQNQYLESICSSNRGKENFSFLLTKNDSGFHLVHFIKENNKTTKYEFYYNLKSKEYYIKRNDKQVKFTENNLIPIFYAHGNTEVILDLIGTEVTRSLFDNILITLGKLYNERSMNIARAFERLIGEYSFFEILWKAGVVIDVNFLDHINTDGKSPHEILNIDRSRWKLMSKYNIPWNVLVYMKNNPQADELASNLMDYLLKLNKKYNVDRRNEFIRDEFNKIFKGYDYYSIIELSEKYNLNLLRLLEYLYYEIPIKHNLEVRQCISMLRDYYRMSEDIDDVNVVRYPKDLKVKHDKVQKLYQFKNDNIKQELFESAKEDFSKYNHSLGNYVIIPPSSIDEIIEEGNKLSHCVSSYVDKVLGGDSIILFLRNRKEVNRPLATLEIVRDEVVQARGRFNRKLSESQMKVVDSFAERFNLKNNYK